jgi:hypothetical protein
MTPNAFYLLLAALGMVLLTFLVGARMLYSRVQEMRSKRMHPQTAATSQTLAGRLENVQAADNFRNLFETPVLFYALVACAIAVSHVPPWLVIGAWCYFGLRVAHSLIHCTYNRVMHRLAIYGLSFGLLVALWVSYVVALSNKGLL